MVAVGIVCALVGIVIGFLGRDLIPNFDRSSIDDIRDDMQDFREELEDLKSKVSAMVLRDGFNIR